MVIVLVKEVQLVVVINDLDFGVRDVAYEAKVLNRYATLDQITNISMENLGYAFCIMICWTWHL
jgi:hypothetical protein